MTPILINERRDVLTGKLVPLHRSLFDRPKSKVPYFEVVARACKPPCHCDGFEVIVSKIERSDSGTSAGPVWHGLSASSPEEARAMSKKIRALLRPLLKTWKGSDPEPLVETLLYAFAKHLGYAQRARTLWGPRG